MVPAGTQAKNSKPAQKDQPPVAKDLPSEQETTAKEEKVQEEEVSPPNQPQETTQGQAPTRAVSKENRDLFKRAKKDAKVLQKYTAGIMLGFAGSGKTTLFAAIFGKTPPKRRFSTLIAEVPVQAIGFVRMTVERCDSTEGESLEFNRVDDDRFSTLFLKSAKEAVSKDRPAHGVLNSLQRKFKKIRQLVSKPDEPTDQVEKDLLFKFDQIGASEESLEDHVLIEMSDFGGQPQFLEVLPRYIGSMSLAFLVIDLSQEFRNTVYYYSKPGESAGEETPYQLTNDQVLRQCLCMVASRVRGGQQMRVVIVGTHRDQEAECPQSRQEKNQVLKNLVEVFGLERCLVHRSRDELIFPVNAQNPDEEDLKTIEDLRRVLLDEGAARVMEIPLSYYAVELTLKEMVRDTGHIAFDESALLGKVSHYYLNKDSLKDALRHLHRNKRVFYFEEEFPGRVIGEPQAIFNKHTKLVAYHIELTTNRGRAQVLDAAWIKFSESGILTTSCLLKYPEHYVDGVFTPEDMMMLFEKLLIVSEVKDGEFLMPSVLPADRSVNCNPDPGTRSVLPLALHFHGGAARFGVFCATICHLMTKSNWRLYKSANSHISRNSVHFSIPGYPGKVTINDPWDSFFLVTIHDVPSANMEKLSRICVMVRDTLIQAINEVTEKLGYDADTPRPAFLCEAEEHKETSPHPATLSEFQDELLCTRGDDVTRCAVRPEHLLWIKGTSSYSVPMTIRSLRQFSWRNTEGTLQTFELVSRVSARWRDLGIELGFEPNQLESWKRELHTNEERWDKVMQSWLDDGGSRYKYAATWEGLKQLLRAKTLGRIADELEKALDHCHH